MADKFSCLLSVKSDRTPPSNSCVPIRPGVTPVDHHESASRRPDPSDFKRRAPLGQLGGPYVYLYRLASVVTNYHQLYVRTRISKRGSAPETLVCRVDLNGVELCQPRGLTTIVQSLLCRRGPSFLGSCPLQSRAGSSNVLSLYSSLLLSP